MQTVNSNDVNQTANTDQEYARRDNDVRVSNTNLISLTTIDAPTKLLPLGPETINRKDDEIVSHRSPTNQTAFSNQMQQMSPAVKQSQQMDRTRDLRSREFA